MSDRITALQLLLSNAQQDTADKASSHFSKKFAKEPAAMQDWLRAVGQSDRPNNQKNIQRVMSTPGLIDLRDQEAVAALLDDGFGNSPPNFKSEDGAGYTFYIDAIMQVWLFFVVLTCCSAVLGPPHSAMLPPLHFCTGTAGLLARDRGFDMHGIRGNPPSLPPSPKSTHPPTPPGRNSHNASFVLQVDKVNPPAAASLLGSFADYKSMSKPRRKLVKAQLRRLSKQGSQLSSGLQDTLNWLLQE